VFSDPPPCDSARGGAVLPQPEARLRFFRLNEMETFVEEEYVAVPSTLHSAGTMQHAMHSADTQAGHRPPESAAALFWVF